MANIYAPPRQIDVEYSKYSGSVNNLGYFKTSNTIEQFSQKARYDAGNEFWVTTENTNGTIGYNSNSTQRTISISSGATDQLGIQTKQSFVYLSGNVHRFTSAIYHDLQTNCSVDWGIFDSENGAFFRLTKTVSGFNFYCGRRSKATGSVVDTLVLQSNFNIDKMDGTGPSGITLDFSKIQMLHIEFSWYGGGGIIYGVEIDRKIIYFHWESAGNHLPEPIFGQPDLPVRYHIHNSQATTGTSTVYIGGIFVGVDGSFEARKGKARSLVNEQISVTQGNTFVLCSIRPRINFKGQINRGYIKLNEIFLYGTADGYYYVSLNPTASNTPTWTNVNTNESIIEYSTNYTITTNDGINLYGGAISSQRESNRQSTFESKEPLTAFSDGSGSNIVSLIFYCQTGGTIGCGFNWSEYY